MSDGVLSLKLEYEGVMFSVVSGWDVSWRRRDSSWTMMKSCRTSLELRKFSLVQSSMDMFVQETEMMRN